MDFEKTKDVLNYLFFGIHEKYNNKKKEIKNQSRLEKTLKSIGYDLVEGAETTSLRIIPFFSCTLGAYAINMRSYKLAINSFCLAALIIGADIYRYLKKKD
jgi:hypothetical protein